MNYIVCKEIIDEKEIYENLISEIVKLYLASPI